MIRAQIGRITTRGGELTRRQDSVERAAMLSFWVRMVPGDGDPTDRPGDTGGDDGEPPGPDRTAVADSRPAAS
jgi:hypothetical protein